ncbi:CCAAT/enhancer-binding protein delta-like [Mixophyes fleayi]|uniref:CCAAT/enhancer-binding protein delta-like n=1 Tax=Mixophyes fleayi TaxID=3061075 RepID=UPI003F4E0DEB
MSALSISLVPRCASPYAAWCLEPTNFYEKRVNQSPAPCKPRVICKEMEPPMNSSNLAELSAALAIYNDKSAINFSTYIDSMSSLPNLELGNDELFMDLFKSNHKNRKRVELGADYYISRLLAPQCQSQVSHIKQKPEWNDSDNSSFLPCQIAICAQTSMSLQPTSPEPCHQFCMPSTTVSTSCGKDRMSKKNIDHFSPEYRQRKVLALPYKEPWRTK